MGIIRSTCPEAQDKLVSMAKYITNIEMAVWADSDKEAHTKAEELARYLRQREDNDARVVELCKPPEHGIGEPRWIVNNA
jgi:hypothetical protein